MATAHNPYAPSQKAPETTVEAKPAEEPQESVKVEEVAESVPETSNDTVPDGPAAEVLAWVGEDKDRAAQALEAEDAGQQRVGLTKKLKELAE